MWGSAGGHCRGAGVSREGRTEVGWLRQSGKPAEMTPGSWPRGTRARSWYKGSLQNAGEAGRPFQSIRKEKRTL